MTDSAREDGTMIAGGCGCSHEDGPCEGHGTVVVIREGASVRTADESLVVFVDDAVSLGAELSPWGRETLREAREALESNRSHGVAWFPGDEDGAGLQDAMVTLSDAMDTELSTLGYWVTREDGYTITRVTGGPLAD